MCVIVQNKQDLGTKSLRECESDFWTLIGTPHGYDLIQLLPLFALRLKDNLLFKRFSGFLKAHYNIAKNGDYAKR